MPDNKNKEILLLALEMALKYGIPAILTGIRAFEKEEITLQDIEDLKIEKEPEEF